MAKAAQLKIEQFDDYLAHFLAKIGKSMGEVMRWQMGLMGKNLITYTASTPGDSMAVQKKKLEGNIETDLRRIFVPVGDEALEKWRSRLSESGESTIRLWFDDPRGIAHKDQVLSSPMRDWHVNHRKKKNGRTFLPKATDKYAFGGKKLSTESWLNAYIEGIKKHVGQLKAGWMEGTMYFIRKAQISDFNVSDNIPSWVSRHYSAGTVPNVNPTDQYDENNIDGKWNMGNAVSYAPNFTSVLNFCKDIRIKDMSPGGQARNRIKGMFREAFKST